MGAERILDHGWLIALPNKRVKLCLVLDRIYTHPSSHIHRNAHTHTCTHTHPLAHLQSTNMHTLQCMQARAYTHMHIFIHMCTHTQFSSSSSIRCYQNHLITVCLCSYILLSRIASVWTPSLNIVVKKKKGNL